MNNPSINRWRTAFTGLRIAITATGHIFTAGGRVLRASGAACEKLGTFARDKAERFRGSPH